MTSAQRSTLLEVLAAKVRGLSDEELVEVAAPWIASQLDALFEGRREPAHESEPKRRPAPAKAKTSTVPAAKTTGGGRAVARETGAPSGIENVFAALAASPTALLVADLAKKVKASPQATRMALKRLQKQKRAFCAGAERRTFWAIDQSIADEAEA